MAELIESEAGSGKSDIDVRFTQLVGQERVRDVLTRASRTGRIAHAYLFLGDHGAGKEAAALDFARVLLCRSHAQRRGNEPDTFPCEQCESCAQSRRLSHPGLRILFPLPKPQSPKEGEDTAEAVEQYTAAQQKQIEGVLAAKAEDFYAPLAVPGGQEILVDHIRSLRQEFRLTSYSGGWRVVLVSQADRLRVQAANAFLKLLEEPPPNVVFILTSSRESRLLSTIVSRCQVLRFALLDRDTIRRNLQERLALDGRRADAATRLANGSWRRAVEWAQGDPAAETERAVDLLRELVRGDPGTFDELVDRWSAPAKTSEFAALLDVLTLWLRDVQRWDAHPEGEPELSRDEQLVKFATFTEGRPFEDALAALAEARLDLERRVQPALVAYTLFRSLQRVLFARAGARTD